MHTSPRIQRNVALLSGFSSQKSKDRERAQRFAAAAMPLLDDLYAYARYLLRNREDAEDAVQEAYLLGFQHFDSFRGTNIKPWLITILRNVCHGEFAKRLRRETSVDLSESAGSVGEALWQAPQATPAQIIERQEEDAAVRKLVDALPTPFRATLVEREFNDQSYADVAAATGAPVGTVMSRLSRARALLRKSLVTEDA